MDRRTFLTAALASPALLAVLQACGSDSNSSSTTPGSPSTPATPTTDSTSSTTPTTATSTSTASTASAKAGEARSSKARATTSAGDAVQAITVVNDFGVDMYHRLASPTDGADGPTNLVFSPASIALALAMTRAGALGTTATEMDAVLHAGDPATLPHSMNSLTTELGARTKTVEVPGAEPTNVELSIANSLWAQQDLAFETTFLDLLATEYGAGLQLVDYKSDPEGARALINQWVDEATKDRIPELLAPGVITPDARLTLVNAIYMKAAWETAFDENLTLPRPFTTSAGKTVQAPMMSRRDDMQYASTHGWEAVVLPYVGGDLSMVIMLPAKGEPLDPTVDAFGGLDGQLGPQLVNLMMPKFDIETSVGLADVLGAMGMPTAFDPLAADFSGMTKEEALFIAAVIHQANITVDEDGTEAAAATAVVMETTAAQADPPQPIDFVVDRPFVFAIRDNTTSAILFLGHIGDPSAG